MEDAYPDLLRPGNRWPIDSCTIASASLPLSSSRFGDLRHGLIELAGECHASSNERLRQG